MTLADAQTIGICGDMGSGKDEAAKIIQALRPEVVIRKFATPLREVVKTLTGLPPSETETRGGKNRYLPAWGMTVGQMLQKLGTDAIREHLHPDAWVLSAMRTVPYPEVTLFSDVRFPNEADAIWNRDGVIIRIVRGGEEHSGSAADSRDRGHVSEHALAADTKNIVTVLNDGDLASLQKKLENLLYD